MAVRGEARGLEARQSGAVMAALFGVGLLPASIGAWGAWTEHQRIETWQAVPARVLVSEARTSQGTRYGKRAHARLRYRYRSFASLLFPLAHSG